MATDDAIRRWTIDDHENARFEDDHVEPYVHLRRISADPAVREVTFPPERHARRALPSVRHAVHHPVRGVHRRGRGLVPAGRAAVGAGRGHLRPGAGRARRRHGPHRVHERTVRRAVGSRLMVLVATELAVERPDQVALRDDDVALGWAAGERHPQPRRQRTRRARSRPRPPDRRARREPRRDRARAPRRPARRRVDRPGQLPPQRRRGDVHPRRLRRPGAVRRTGDGRDRDRRRPPGRRAGRDRLGPGRRARHPVVGGLAGGGVAGRSRHPTSSPGRT